MIIYGTGSSKVAEDKIRANCPNCDSANTTTMFIYQRHAHVFWIPLFPAGKIAATQCSNCNQVTKREGFTERFREEYETLKDSAKTPWWTFIGLAIIACIVVFAIFESNEDDKRTADMVQNPQVGDMFEIRSSATEFALIKVVKVAGDSVHVLENEFISNQPNSINDLDEKPYAKESFSMHKNELKKMLDSEDITDTKRP